MLLGMDPLVSFEKLDGNPMAWCTLFAFLPLKLGADDACLHQIFARKELYFERMSDRDKKQIVSEVQVVTGLFVILQLNPNCPETF
jgi:hypothetical protein